MKQHNRVRLSKLSLGLLIALAAAPAFAQSTSAGVGGQVTGTDGQPVGGATVTILHSESGTVSRAITDPAGRYSARGLRVGGPYTITVTKEGAGTDVEENIYLTLDQVMNVNATLASGGGVNTLDTVSVTAQRSSQVFASDNKGVGNSLTRAELDRLPSPDRSIQNVVRTNPNIVVTDRDRGAFSAMGQNFRYNSITIDNINAGDPFGLNDNGLPTKGTPISQDAIEGYNISTANFDVTTRRGVGAVINAVTKSGTNDFHGSVYYAYQDVDSMVGERNGEKWKGYTKDSTFGVTIGGPILKDKLFFFLSYEEGKKESPGSIAGPANSNATIKVPGVTQANVDEVIRIANGYGLTPGDLGSASADITSKRALAKFDWNINDFHRASLRLSQTKEYEPIITSSTATGASPSLKLSSNWYVFDKKNTSYALSLYDDWSDSFSTEASFGYNEFSQTRGPLVGGYQPDIVVRFLDTTTPGPNLAANRNASAGSNVEFGTEFSSQANVLEVKTYTAAIAGSWYFGNHTIKGGMDYQQDEVYNLFLQNYTGSYTFNSLADFASGTYRQYRLNVPAAGYTLDNVAAVFKQKQFGFFIQDTWQATDKLSVQYGVRYDLPQVSPDPTYNPCFAAAPGAGSLKDYGVCGLRANTAVNSNLASNVGGYGFTNQGTIDGNGVFQPRFSFNYDMSDTLSRQLRGGAGLFVSNTPAVWVANPYSNNGVATTSYDINRRRLPTDPAFSPDAFNQNIPGSVVTPPGLGSSQMNLSVLDPDFQIPTVAKYTLAIDQELPWKGVVFTAEFQHLDVVKGIYYQNLNLGGPTGTLPDGRLSYARDPRYAPNATLVPAVVGPPPIAAVTNTQRWNANPSFGQQVIYLTNTDKGQSNNFTVSLTKPFADSWSAMLAYTFSRATEVNPGTSSVANSSFQNRDWVNPNDATVGISNYSIPNRIIAQVSWQHNFFGDYATGFTAFYDGHNGAPYSWIFGNDVNGDSYTRDLAYVPSGPGDVLWTSTSTPQLQASFWEYVSNDSDLQRARGSIFRSNAARAPWISQVDLSFRQQIPGFFKGNKAELRFDLFNVLNMIDKSWGVEKRASFPGERTLANFAGIDADTGKYIYDISGAQYNQGGVYKPQVLPVNESFNPSQRWSVLATVRYTF